MSEAKGGSGRILEKCAPQNIREIDSDLWEEVMDVDEIIVQNRPRLGFRIGVLRGRDGELRVAVGLWHGRSYRYAAMDKETARKLYRSIRCAVYILEEEEKKRREAEEKSED